MVKTLPLDEALNKLELPELDRNLFSSPAWMAVLQKTYSVELFVKFIEKEGRVRSYVFYSVVKNFLEWKICICSYCDYSDAHVENLEDWDAIIADLKREYPRYRIAIRNLRDDIVRQCGALSILSQECFHVLDVRKSLDEISKAMNDSFKAQLHQAQRQGVVVKKCKKAELKKFYNLHLKVRKNKYNIFPQPYCFFSNIWDQYMEDGRGVLLGAYDADGRFIGGNVYLVCGNTLYYKFNTSDVRALKLRPNNILFWEGIRFAKERQLDYIDLGSSGYHQEGLIRYKNHTGAQAMNITHLGYNPPDYKFSEKRILKVMTKLFTQPWMPDVMIKMGSHIIYPFLA